MPSYLADVSGFTSKIQPQTSDLHEYRTFTKTNTCTCKGTRRMNHITSIRVIYAFDYHMKVLDDGLNGGKSIKTHQKQMVHTRTQTITRT